MKKALVLVVVLGGGVVLGWWGLNSVTKQDSFLVSIAFGFPKDGEIELHGIISLGMTAQEPPRLDPKLRGVNWDEWLTQHLQLRDAADQPVKVLYKSGTDVIPANKIKGAVEGYFFARMKQNAPYTLDFIPKRAEPMRFRHAFTAPAEAAQVETPAFQRV